MSACRNDYCAATTDEEKKEIICDKMAVYAYYCMYRGFPINYRTTDLCRKYHNGQEG